MTNTLIMKTTNFLLVSFFCITAISISNAQVEVLNGTWNLNEFTFINEENTDTMNSDKLREDDSVWDLFFMETNKFKQTSNMSGSGTMDSQEGTWKTSNENLTFDLEMNEQKIELNYTYELKDNTLILNRSNPVGTMKVIAKFKRI